MDSKHKNICIATTDESKRDRAKEILGNIRTRYGIRSDDILLMALELLKKKCDGGEI